MAIKFKAIPDAAQKAIEERTVDFVRSKNDSASAKSKVAGSNPAVSAQDMSNEDIDAFVARQLAEEQRQLQSVHDRFFAAFQNEERRKIYNAAYQRDLRTIKRLGLNCTVKEWREKNDL